MHKALKTFLLVFPIFFTIFFYTHGISGNFFQQDEWGGFGTVMRLSVGPFWGWLNSFGGVHFSPLGSLFWFMLYKFFDFQAQYYVLIQLALHIITSFLVYIFAEKLTKSWRIGALTALFFVTNAHASQAFLHLATFPTLIAALFAVLFFVYLTYARDRKYFFGKDLMLLLTIFFTSVFFKEDGLIILPLFLIYLFLFDKQKFNKKNLWFFLTFFGPIVFFGLFRLMLQFTSQFSPIVFTSSFLHTYIYNLFTFPVKFIAQNIVEGSSLFTFLWTHNDLIYANNSVNVLGSYPVFMDFAFLMIMIILVIIFIFIKDNFANKKEAMNYLWFAVAWLILDAALLSAIGRQLYILESRYLYLPSVMVFSLISFILVKIYEAKLKHVGLNNFKNIIVFVIVLSALVNSYFSMQSIVKKQAFYGTARKSILSSLLGIHPTIPKDTIFYVRCKTVCYRNREFNVENKLVLPFTLGSGWVILTQYAKGNEDKYARFFNEMVGNNRPFLGDLGSQGYKKFGDYGFGYYYDENALRRKLKEENLSPEIVIGLEYDEKDFTMQDITPEVRSKL